MVSIEEIEEAYKQEEVPPFEDPAMARASFPLRRTFYPMGFPVELTTNAEEVLKIATANWSAYPKLFNTPPIRLQVGVVDGKFPECPVPSSCRVQHGILTNFADGDNFAVCDLNRGISSVWVTRTTLAQRDLFRYCFLDAPVYCQLATREATAIHGACVVRNGVGILLCGDSGAGKSTLSYACAQAGWTYVTDDASYLVLHRDDRTVVGNCNQVRFRPPAMKFFSELHGSTITQRLGHGKPSIEFSTASRKQIHRAHSAKIEKVIFLNRRHPPQQELLPYSKQVARHFMLGGLYGSTDTQALQSAAIDHLLEVDVLELRYQDLGWAVVRLERLIQDRGL